LKEPADEGRLPLSLVEALEAETPEGMGNLLKFLAPITVPGRKGVVGM